MRVRFRSSDGISLVGILERPKKKTDKCIILCHGITVDKEEDGIFTNLSAKLAKNGFAVFRFDFRGHGESGGKSINMTVLGEEKDLEAACGFLTDKGYRKFGIVAASFAGGAVSFFVPGHQNMVKALVLWNSLLNYGSGTWKRWLGGGNSAQLREKGYITRNGFKIGKKLLDEMRGLEPWKELKKLRIPIMFVHGDRDEAVPYADSVKYSKMLKAELNTIKGATHGFHDNKRQSDQADNVTIAFFLQVID